jgi:hypothetical protein
MQQAQIRFDAEFDRAGQDSTHSIRQIAARTDFREAVAWQNRHALRTGIDPLLRDIPDHARTSKSRQREHLVGNYLQRYCAKNDTIGFFGPVGWVRLVSDGPRIQVRTGESLLARRNLYFESWCIDTLVEHLADHHALLPWIAPRRNCTSYQRDDVVHSPLRRPVRLTVAERALLAACDSYRTAKSIAADLIRAPHLGFSSASDVYGLLDTMQQRGIIWWKLELPRDLRPERSLRELLGRIDDLAAKAPLERALDELEAIRRKLADAAGDADATSAALANLDATFNEITGQAATRSAGKTYAGRTLVYEDCVRDCEVEIGPDVLAEIGPALSLMLDSARWLSYANWFAYKKIARSIYATLARTAPSAQVDFVRFWLHMQPYFFERREEVSAAAVSQFQKRWARILNVPPGQKRLDFSSDALRAAVTREFSIPERPRNLTPYHSPDLMFAAASVEAFRRGDYLAVMGELHAGMNTLGWPLFIEQHPSPGELFDAVDRDIADPRVVAVVPKGAFGDVTRVFPAFVSPRDYFLEFQTGAARIPEGRGLPIAELVVDALDGELILRTREGDISMDLLTGFNQLIDYVTATQFKVLDASGITPRVTIDRLVISRGSWSFPLSNSGFAFEKDEAGRFLRTREWAMSNGLPRFVFIRIPGEQKPVYIDLESRTYVEILAKAVRRAATDPSYSGGALTLTEMLPTMEESWLPGASGENYTCEVRMVAVDHHAKH